MSPKDVFEGYRPEINKVIEITSTYRGINEYAEKLGFPDSESFLVALPKGASILDIGGGKEGLKKELAVTRPDLVVFSINPSLGKSQHRQFYSTPNAILGINPELPIRSNSVDRVLDNMASIYFSEDLDDSTLRNYLLEIIRVLKNGASAFVGPSFIFPNKDFGGKGKIGNMLNGIESITWQKKSVHFETSNDKIWRAYHIYKK